MSEPDTTHVNDQGVPLTNSSGFLFSKWFRAMLGAVLNFRLFRKNELSDDDKKIFGSFEKHSKPSPLKVRARNFVEKNSLAIIATIFVLIAVSLLWWQRAAIAKHMPQEFVAQVTKSIDDVMKSKSSKPQKADIVEKVDKKAVPDTVVVAQVEKDLSQPACPPDCFPPDQIPADVLKKASQAASSSAAQQKASAPVPSAPAASGTVLNSPEVAKMSVPQPKPASAPKPTAPVEQEALSKKQEVPVTQLVTATVATSAPKPLAPALAAGTPQNSVKKVISVSTQDEYQCARRAPSGALLRVNCGRGKPIVLPNGDITCQSRDYLPPAPEKVCYGVQR